MIALNALVRGFTFNQTAFELSLFIFSNWYTLFEDWLLLKSLAQLWGFWIDSNVSTITFVAKNFASIGYLSHSPLTFFLERVWNLFELIFQLGGRVGKEASS